VTRREVDERPALEPDYSVPEIADALGMSTRWVTDTIKRDGVPHVRYGRKIRMTAEQVAEFRRSHIVAPRITESITTGPAKGVRR